MTEIERRLEVDLVAATRARSPELTVLRTLKSAIHNEQIAKQSADGLSMGEVVAVLRRELKRRQEAAQLYEQGGRPELAAKEKQEAAVISRYLPPTPSAEEIKKVMITLAKEQGWTDIKSVGPLTKATLTHFNGLVDGQTVSTLAKEILSQT